MLKQKGTDGAVTGLLNERLNHLQALEAESLYILREAVAEFFEVTPFLVAGHHVLGYALQA